MADRQKELKREARQFGEERIEVIFRESSPTEDLPEFYPPVAPGVSVEDGILIERDVAVPLRDGTLIYTDICRPEGAKNLPAIVCWSPYGKNSGWAGAERRLGMPMSLLIPPGAVSPLSKFEAADPAYWCHYGYAVINPDARGAGNSEGDANTFGTAEARDCYDLIEWVAAQNWSNGRVTMAGNSWLAVIQWATAAERPPHLTCIAPWSGFTDVYRAMACRGGIPEVNFTNFIVGSMMRGHGGVEDMTAMAREYPLMNGYWEDKIPKLENIQIPTYVTANYNLFHNLGMDAFRRIPAQNKWLRIENTMEWPDNYEPQNLEDLRRFFDRYLKGIRNGWEFTPRVRISVHDPGGVDQVNRPEHEWPLARAEHQKLYLDAATGTLSPTPVEQESLARYQADGKGEATFTIRFDEDTELVGYWKLRLWVEAEGADDMDLFVAVQKLDQQGNLLSIPFSGQPHGGISGMLRVSHRELDEERSTPSEPYLKHRRQQLLKPNEIVPVEIPLWPLGMLWHAGQQLRVVVSDHAQATGNGWDLINRGEHMIHTGGKYDSQLLVPVIPR